MHRFARTIWYVATEDSVEVSIVTAIAMHQPIGPTSLVL
jgi:hypothetical protein